MGPETASNEKIYNNIMQYIGIYSLVGG